MTIPAPLAYPPTALRNVAAGLVVGNPIGSSGTRAKALTSAELKAVVEASGISYLLLSGGTLTGPITGTSGLIEQRNGLTAQCFDLFETYTSGTNNGKLRFKATSSGHQIGSARASSGSNRAVQLGHFDASDVFASAISIATTGAVSVAGTLTYSDGTIDARTSMNHALTLRATGAANAIRVLDSGGTTKWAVDSTGSMTIGTLGYITFPHSTTVGDPNQVITGGGTGLGLRTSGSLFVATGGPGATFTVDAAGKVTSTSQMIHVPPTSTITLGTNGQFSIEMTSNTAGNLVYRGSDGTTRRMALTFS